MPDVSHLFHHKSTMSFGSAWGIRRLDHHQHALGCAMPAMIKMATQRLHSTGKGTDPARREEPPHHQPRRGSQCGGPPSWELACLEGSQAATVFHGSTTKLVSNPTMPARPAVLSKRTAWIGLQRLQPYISSQNLGERRERPGGDHRRLPYPRPPFGVLSGL